MTDGPLIVQSDKTLLLEVDHPAGRGGPRPPSRRSPSWSARPSTSTPTGSPRWAVERARRRARRRAGRRRAGALLALRGAARAAGRRRRHHGPLRSAAAGQATRCTGWCWSASTAPCSRRSCGRRRSPRCSARGSTTTPCWSTRPSAGSSSRRCSRSAGRPRTSPATSTARPIRSTLVEDGWTLRDYQQQAVDSSGPAVPAWSCCRAARARRWSAPRRWPRPRPPR